MSGKLSPWRPEDFQKMMEQTREQVLEELTKNKETTEDAPTYFVEGFPIEGMRFYFGTLQTKTELSTGLFMYQRNFISNCHPALTGLDYANNVILFCQEISEDMYILLRQKGYYDLTHEIVTGHNPDIAE